MRPLRSAFGDALAGTRGHPAHHRHRLKPQGPGTARAEGWRDDYSPCLRFDTAASMADFNGASALDLGCSPGGLMAFVDARHTATHCRGIELLPDFVAQARARFGPQSDTAFSVGTFARIELPRADIVVTSGALG